jgi:hypothetical protein
MWGRGGREDAGKAIVDACHLKVVEGCEGRVGQIGWLVSEAQPSGNGKIYLLGYRGIELLARILL